MNVKLLQLFLKKLSDIIERDFFPHLEKLKVQSQFLDAVESNDIAKLKQIYEKYSLEKKLPVELQRRIDTPATFETPVAHLEPGTPLHDDEKSKDITRNKDEPKLSLDEFVATHTSEDNESFQEIMNDAFERHKKRYWWLYKQEEYEKDEAKKSRLALPSVEQQAITNSNDLRKLDTWTYTNKNAVMFVPNGADLTGEEMLKQRLAKPVIVHENTRFSTTPFDDRQSQIAVKMAAQSNAKQTAGHIDVDGSEIKVPTTPQVGGFKLLRTPSPMPGVGESPYMTWGEIEGTPFKLDGSDTPLPPHTPGPSFTIHETPLRDQIGYKLAEKVSQQYRDRKGKAIEAARKYLPSTPQPGSNMDRIATMSPAARRLATARLGVRLPTDGGLSGVYTPSPLRRLNTPATPVVKTPRTPVVKTPARGVKTPTGSLTDNLLQIPKRKL
ncbi:hypothetical protein QYM36_016325 [Artemia franciscana]|uniref:Uncharacterized protein n=1 Tax=Artemia franciscana TaxID=6661 RepID=A0AA88KTL3_ARTSF|nr:hypothetical protein QYM36_016325 [Artemia franciscana]